MEPIQDTERKYRMNIAMGGRGTYRTKYSYTMEQAEEINDIMTEKLRSVLGCIFEIAPGRLTVTKD